MLLVYRIDCLKLDNLLGDSSLEKAESASLPSETFREGCVEGRYRGKSGSAVSVGGRS